MKGCVLLSILSYAYSVRVAKPEYQNALASFSEKVFDPASEDPNVGDAMHNIADHVDLASAVTKVQQKDLPPQVAILVQSTSEGKSGGFNESSLAKGRIALNSLIEKAWPELDAEIVRCKGFQETNRLYFASVNRDIARLVEQITDLERVESESVDGISTTDEEIRHTEELRRKEMQAYLAEKQTNEAQLAIHKNDLEVFQFIMEFTKCPPQETKSKAAFVQATYQVCETTSGRRTLLFRDQQTAKRFKKLLQPGSRQRLDSLLALVQPHQAPSFFQLSLSTPVLGEDGLPCAAQGYGNEDECMKSCSPDDAPDCGLLHDKLSLMWGEFKDDVDALTMEIAKNKDRWEELDSSLNGQIDLLRKKKSRFNMLLAEARSNLASDRQEKKDKEKEKRTLDEKYQEEMAKCKKKIEWMIGEMCAIKVVRNAVLEASTVCPSSKIVDCDMGVWKRGDCTKTCDDSCNPEKPFECGGWQALTRDTVTANDECGIQCPATTHKMRCGQFPCFVDCVMSSWSGWSACSADCEGGVEGRTRSILVKPKNGGQECNTPEESRACNTMSCDRNCKLAKWTKWSPCSVACGGGLQQTRRHVLRPTRGDGKCPRADKPARYRQRACNTRRCKGDEVCTAKQDLVVAIDGSGSLQQEGFDVLKRFAETLLSRYQSKYFGVRRVKIGVCQFGNGEVMPDGKTISPAINVQPLSFDKDAALKAVQDLTFKKGFTNMAQAFATAETMFTLGSRKSAQQSVLVITDGKPSFAFETQGQVEALDDKNIMRYFVVVSDPGNSGLALMKSWASQPWETNLVHVKGGLAQLESDAQTFAQEALTKFCPLSYSPGAFERYEMEHGIQKVFKGGWCQGTRWRWGGWVPLRNSRLRCKKIAERRNHQVFLMRQPRWVRVRRGWRRYWRRYAGCYTGDDKVTPAQYDQWLSERPDPQCKTRRLNYRIYDMYAIVPKEEQVCRSMGIRVSRKDDCTGKQMWKWAGGHTGFSASAWSTESYDTWGGEGTCVVYARTRGKTCKDYCKSFGRTCQRGMDDAHHQVNKLNYWLRGKGKAGTMCTTYGGGHSRQTTAENGCLQKWGTQMCACK